MVLSAATALVRDRQSFFALRRFVLALNVAITLGMLVLVLPPVFRLLTEGLIGLPSDVARLTHTATVLLLPWPAAIGYRRFFHGILIRSNATRRVALGTLIRLITMATTGLALYVFGRLPGVIVAAISLSSGVVVEAIAARLMATGAVERILTGAANLSADLPLTTRSIARFYLPLALTSMLTLAVNPLVTFFMGRSRMSLESLAVLPVVTSFVFIFRGGGVAFQEVCIALLGGARNGQAALRRFAVLLGGVLTGCLALVALTPLSRLWFGSVVGLAPELAAFTLIPLLLLALQPALEVLLSFQRSLLVHSRHTVYITWGTAVEVAGIVAVLLVGVSILGLVGAIAAASALLVGRICANLFLLRPAFAGRRG
jgi:hypothetical protein